LGQYRTGAKEHANAQHQACPPSAQHHVFLSHEWKGKWEKPVACLRKIDKKSHPQYAFIGISIDESLETPRNITHAPRRHPTRCFEKEKPITPGIKGIE
jgi:hypothetical protein